MKMRLTVPGGAQGAWLTAGRSAAGAVLVAVTVSACTSSGSSVPSVFTPTPQTGAQSGASSPGSPASSPGSSANAPGRGGASPSGSHAQGSAQSSPSAPATTAAPDRSASSPRPPAHAATPVFPTAAPETGGGGTAGLQDGLLFGVGGLAVFAGAGSLALRRRLARKFKAGDPVGQSPPNREPADR